MSGSEKNLKIFRRVLDLYLSELKKDSYICPNCVSDIEDIFRCVKKDSLLYFCKVSKRLEIKVAIEESIRYGCSHSLFNHSLFNPAAVNFDSNFCKLMETKGCCYYNCPKATPLKAKRTFEEYLSMAMDKIFPKSKVKTFFCKFVK